ncbi:hypothetical protein YPPY04_2994, partial [Yersinia pestis PY-04]
MAGEGI